ncbi:MAG: chloride channel protein family [Chloroflexota bacterium]|nr:chloride channel protein family [Chloroflexota bacterium]
MKTSKKNPAPSGALSLREWSGLLLAAAAAGLLAGLVVSIFGFLLDRIDALREALFLWAQQARAFGWLLPILYTILTAGIAILLVRRFAPQAGGGGIPHLLTALRDGCPLGWQRLLPVKFAACLFSLGSGLLLGRVGPAVQIGAAGSDALAERFKLDARQRRWLLGAGGGAGLAALYNVPAAGLAFSLEVLLGRFSLPGLISALVAAGLADLTTRLLRGGDASFVMPRYAPVPAPALLWFALLGIAAGLFGALYHHAMLGSLKFSLRFSGKAKWFQLIAICALVGLAAWADLDWIGGGHRLTENALGGTLALRVVPLLLIVRFVLTALSFSSGAPGGIVAPMLALGALAGLLFGQGASYLVPGADLQPAVFAVAGMAALFAAALRAPITAVLLAMEMTGDYYLILPLAIASLCAHGTAYLLKSRSLYSDLALVFSANALQNKTEAS